jgi:hypothetical protein
MPALERANRKGRSRCLAADVLELISPRTPCSQRAFHRAGTMKRVLLILAAAALLAPAPGHRAIAQQPPRAIRRTMPITDMIQRAFGAGTRDSTGRPGPDYWQTSADYTIDARLDPTTSVVTGKETIVLHNNSPEPMQDIYFRLDQSIYGQNVPRDTRVPEVTDGMIVTALTIDGQSVDLSTPAARGEGGFRRSSGPPTEPTAVNFNMTSARLRLSTPVAGSSCGPRPRPNSTSRKWTSRSRSSGMRAATPPGS